MKEKYYLISFDSSQRAIQIEFDAKKIVNEARLIPIPSEVHANCGVGLKIDIDKITLLKDILADEKIYQIERHKGKRAVRWINQDDIFQ